MTAGESHAQHRRRVHQRSPGGPGGVATELIRLIEVLSGLFILRGVSAHIRSENGAEFVAKSVQARITAAGGRTTCPMPGSPWKNNYVESFNTRLRDEFFNGGRQPV